MNDYVIQLSHLTKDYGNGQGIFDISLEVCQGEVFGFIGTNGSGKTTTIRNIMGFIRPDRGTVKILGMDAWKQSVAVKQCVSYVPGEIAFPRQPTGFAFFKSQAEYLGLHDFTYMEELIRRFQLDASANLKRMSKGMKQKTALVAALMGNRQILILDEPTTGLDPLMREVFLHLVRQEKARGKTIFMSSHIFEEIEEVCDRTAMIKDGKLLDIVDIRQLHQGTKKTFHVTFSNSEDTRRFCADCDFAACAVDKENSCEINTDREYTGKLLQLLKKYPLTSLSEKHDTLENRFKQAYKTTQALSSGKE